MSNEFQGEWEDLELLPPVELLASFWDSSFLVEREEDPLCVFVALASAQEEVAAWDPPKKRWKVLASLAEAD